MLTINQIFRISFLITCCVILLACSSVKVKQSVLMPANSNGMKDVKKLAVVGFSGDKDKAFTSKIESFFTNIRVKNKPYFSVVDRDALQRIVQNEILTRQNSTQASGMAASSQQPAAAGDTGIILTIADPLTLIGALLTGSNSQPVTSTNRPAQAKSIQSNISTSDAVKFAKLSGADTIITGSVKGPYVANTPYEEERKKCIQRAKEKTETLPGIKVRKCLKYKTNKIACTKQNASFEFQLKAVNVDSNAVVFSNGYSGSTENKFCEDNKKYAQKSPAALSKIAVDKAIARMRNDVAPYMVTLTIELMDEDDSLLSNNKKAKALLESGLAFAKEKRMDRACDDFRQANENYSQSPALFHNLGVCAEIKNNLDRAENMYEQADSLLKKPEKIISSALSRINDRKMKQQQVSAQLR